MKPGAMTGGSPLEQHVRSAVAAHRDDRGALLPILHDIQSTFGYVDPAVVPILAEELNISRADVHGVISFYHDFRKPPTVGTHVRICRAEACQAAGADALVEHVKEKLRHEHRRHLRPTATPRLTRCSASATARSAPPSRSTAGSPDASPRSGSTPSSIRPGMNMRIHFERQVHTV